MLKWTGELLGQRSKTFTFVLSSPGILCVLHVPSDTRGQRKSGIREFRRVPLNVAMLRS